MLLLNKFFEIFYFYLKMSLTKIGKADKIQQ